MKKINVIYASLWLTAAVFLAGCNPDDPAEVAVGNGNGEDTAVVKLASRIDVGYHDSEVYAAAVGGHEFEYDSLRRVVKWRITYVQYDSPFVLTLTYPTSGTVEINGSGNGATVRFIYKLDGDGNVVSMNNTGYYHWTYGDGYLVKYEYAEGVQLSDTDYTWENGNLTAIKRTYYDGGSHSEGQQTAALEYGAMLNKPCGVDLLWLIVGANDPIEGWFGKSSKNLPEKIIVEDAVNPIVYRYETDGDGYVEKVYVKGIVEEEVLRYVISYK
ncbi:MAG: DUF4595 domain-containing protein [Prevotellaceae bacterium]|jgi:hypothetical protein|nr:DUF4595 domain-containing protein [Prevotellaceae bacterium]